MQEKRVTVNKVKRKKIALSLMAHDPCTILMGVAATNTMTLCLVIMALG